MTPAWISSAAIRLRQGPIGIGSTAVGALGFGAAAYVFAQDPPSPKLGDALALSTFVELRSQGTRALGDWGGRDGA